MRHVDVTETGDRACMDLLVYTGYCLVPSNEQVENLVCIELRLETTRYISFFFQEKILVFKGI